LEDILESDPLYVYQNISVPSVIYSAVLLYPGTGNILEISSVSVLDNLKMCFHQTSHTV
jgi:hypothetical protein